MSRIAIVGLACKFGDAESPTELWENALAGRRAFRRLPSSRISEDYYSANRSDTDLHYLEYASVLEGWNFDRDDFKVGGPLYRSTDLAHWLTLETVSLALADAGYSGAEGLPTSSTAVIIGNTLNGEFSRAGGLRLRWPYIERTLAEQLSDEGWTSTRISNFLGAYELAFKSRFPEPTEDSLAGGLANTIAGRVCNYFNLGGGGFTVDGACSSSLLAVATAAGALVTKQTDAAIVGGVDLSLDPFELVGFSRNGALAASEMLVYDKASSGFWPGEGCGIAILVREEDLRPEDRVYAYLRGWGYSSDGHGGMTRPESDGHLRAIERACAMAGVRFAELGYVEGHGTGTSVGDSVELEVFEKARQGSTARLPIGSIKANIGHTKAAAGIAGLTKAILAVRDGVVPPVSGVVAPHDAIASDSALLELPSLPRRWESTDRRLAGVSSMGFGGINAHVIVENAEGQSVAPDSLLQQLACSRQDVELLLFSAGSRAGLREKLVDGARFADACSFAELGDLSAELVRTTRNERWRAAVIVANPAAAARELRALVDSLDDGREEVALPGLRYLSCSALPPRIGLLFPGQGVESLGTGGDCASRFPEVEGLYSVVGKTGPGTTTGVAQPRIIAAALAGLRILDSANLHAVGVLGHSLGELAAATWAECLTERQAHELAKFRGQSMQALDGSRGAMASIAASPELVESYLQTDVSIAGYNSPRQTVVSGTLQEVESLRSRLRSVNVASTPLKVSHAFHSPLVAPAAPDMRKYLDQAPPNRVNRAGYFSSVTGDELPIDADVAALLVDQIAGPVRFMQAAEALIAGTDLLIEVGPGSTLTRLVQDINPGARVSSLRVDEPTLAGVLDVLAVAFTLGAEPDVRALLGARFSRPTKIDRDFSFLSNPCETGETSSHRVRPRRSELAEVDIPPSGGGAADDGKPVDVLCRLFAEKAELPASTVSAATRPLDELHMSSITITGLVADAARQLNVAEPEVSTNVATATIGDLAELLDSLPESDSSVRAKLPPPVVPWVGVFETRWLEAALRADGTPSRIPGFWEPVGSSDAAIKLLAERLSTEELGSGIVLSLDGLPEDERYAALAHAGRAASRDKRILGVTSDSSIAAFLKSVHLEDPSIKTTIVHLEPRSGIAELIDEVVAEVRATEGFVECRLGLGGARRIPLMSPVDDHDTNPSLLIDPDSVVVIAGGAKGITFESALHIGKSTGAKLALIGRSRADSGPVEQSLDRLNRFGVTASYFQADVTDSAQVEEALREITGAYGAVNVLIYGAGVNTPKAAAELSAEDYRETVQSKTLGVSNILESPHAEHIGLVVAFASIIGRTGLRGEAHYATANEWMRTYLEEYANRNSAVRVHAVEWSVWAGAGMGERLGVLSSLVHDGIQPIPLTSGLETLERLLRASTLPTTVQVLGRSEGIGTLQLYEGQPLPLARFLEKPIVHWPGIELICAFRAELSSDPYLEDHVIDGLYVFPAVMGMEAMAQAASVLLNESVSLENIRFLRAITASPGAQLNLQVHAVRRGDRVVASIRSESSEFTVDHFRAEAVVSDRNSRYSGRVEHPPTPPIDVPTDLYRDIAFQGARFQAVAAYNHASATACSAELTPSEAPWFGVGYPTELQLPDPAVRDAAMHALQVCVPDASLLPTGLVSLWAAPPDDWAGQGRLTLDAYEVRQDGDEYEYDVVVSRPGRGTLMYMRGLNLKATRKLERQAPWPAALLGSYLQRAGGRLLAMPDFKVAVQFRESGSSQHLALALGLGEVHHGPNGQPESSAPLSISHTSALSLGCTGRRDVGCDIEDVQHRPPQAWTNLLGASAATAREMTRTTGEDLDSASTRVWSAMESITKLGACVTRPEVLLGDPAGAPPGWVNLTYGEYVIWTYATEVRLDPNSRESVESQRLTVALTSRMADTL